MTQNRIFLEIRVQFNDSRFALPNSSWSFHEIYFTRKYTSWVKNKWTKHKIMVLKPANKYQQFGTVINFKIPSQQFPASSFSLSSKSFLNIISKEPESYSGAKNIFCKIMQPIFHKTWFLLSFNIRYHEIIFVRYFINLS